MRPCPQIWERNDGVCHHSKALCLQRWRGGLPLALLGWEVRLSPGLSQLPQRWHDKQLGSWSCKSQRMLYIFFLLCFPTTLVTVASLFPREITHCHSEGGALSFPLAPSAQWQHAQSWSSDSAILGLWCSTRGSPIDHRMGTEKWITHGSLKKLARKPPCTASQRLHFGLGCAARGFREK